MEINEFSKDLDLSGVGSIPEIKKAKGDFLHAIFSDDASIEGETLLYECQRLWESVAGPLSRNTTPVKLQSGILHVSATHDVYSQELQLYTRQIIEKLKQNGVKIDKIRIQKKGDGGGKRGYFKTGSGATDETSDNNKRDLSEEQKLLLDGLKKL